MDFDLSASPDDFDLCECGHARFEHGKFVSGCLADITIKPCKCKQFRSTGKRMEVDPEESKEIENELFR